MDSNYLDMLRCLNKAGVDYIMVGGWAVNLHGYVRATIDLDIWILADFENARKVYAALVRKGFSYGDVRDALKQYEEELIGFDGDM